MPTYELGQVYVLYWGLSATAPTTSEWVDPANSSTIHEVGNIMGDITINQSRNVIERRNRSTPNQRFVHMGDRTESVAFTMELDLEDNDAYQDMRTAYQADNQGTGADAQLGYWAVAPTALPTATLQSGMLMWRGKGGISDLTTTLQRQNLAQVNVTIEVDGDLVETTHS